MIMMVVVEQVVMLIPLVVGMVEFELVGAHHVTGGVGRR